MTYGKMISEKDNLEVEMAGLKGTKFIIKKEQIDDIYED